MDEYQRKLKIGDITIPDPLKIKSDWVGEKNGIEKWPSVIYKNIADYFSLLGPDFISQLEREYKLGKAYRYYACEFVREIFYHKVDDISPYCILKCRIVPSQRTSAKPYQVWVVITKDCGDDNPGGQIQSGYCTCTAGLKGSCNHVQVSFFV